MNTSQVGQVRFMLVGLAAHAADDLPSAGDLRRPEGDRPRCPLTRLPDDAPLTRQEAGEVRSSPSSDDDARKEAACALSPTSPHEPGVRQARPDPGRRRRRPAVRRPHRGRRRARRDPARRDHRPDRPQRRRQDDVLQPAHRLRPARQRQLDVQRPSRSPAWRPTRWPGWAWSAPSSSPRRCPS